MNKIYFTALACSLALAACAAHAPPGAGPVAAANPAAGAILAAPRSASHPFEAVGTRYALATQGAGSTAAAETIFRAGGNIIDAAVATSFAIAVERPQSTGLGGGGFLLFREAKSGQTYAVDFRERAPLRARRDMYLGPDGEFLAEKSLNGARAVATPGLVAGLLEVHQKWGRLPLATVLAPAIRLAAEGFSVPAPLAHAIEGRASVLRRDPAAARIFLHANGSPYREGERLVQTDLAQTLRAIAAAGRAGFYEGGVARAILASQRAGGGLLSARDLADYRVKWRTPLRGTFRGREVYTMPPPSSGGIHVLQVLNLLEAEPLGELGYFSPLAIHRTAAALALAFADRAVYPGDPDFVRVPVDWLISKRYAAERRALIPETRALDVEKVGAGEAPKNEHPETTHFSMLDAEGNAVASTQTINYSFGAGVVAPGTGVVLNDEMDDFSAKPGAANVYGALGGRANEIAPGKTPLSSMAPTIVLQNGEPVMAVGAPGGTRIISCVSETILNYFAYKLPAYESVAALRVHHQWRPDLLEIESPGPGAATVGALEEMGYHVKVTGIPCRTELAVKEGDVLRAVSDPRDSGLSLAR